jgi:hypothetical protein
MKLLYTMIAMAVTAFGFVSAVAPDGALDLTARRESLSGCVSSYDGPFQVTILQPHKADAESLKVCPHLMSALTNPACHGATEF